MRIASLVPSATEYLFALGLGNDVVAVTHECDHPLDVLALPRLTRSVIPAGLDAAEIDAAVRERTQAGESLYVLDEELLTEVEPDLIVTQQLCEVCAVSFDDVRAVAERMPDRPNVISLDPSTFGEVLGDIRTIAQATNCKDAGVDLLRALADRVDAIRLAVREVGSADGPEAPHVVALEWLDPVFAAGHWTPQMIELAGGIDRLGMPGERSVETDWDTVAAAEPEVVILMQCGRSASQCADEADHYSDRLRATGATRIFASEAMAHFSRPGPRLVDGLEQLAHALHPTLVPEPASGTFLKLDLDA